MTLEPHLTNNNDMSATTMEATLAGPGASAPIGNGDLERFALAGNARFTVAGKASRFTYKVTASDDGARHYVAVLTGADNEGDYTFVGTIFSDGEFRPGKKSRIGAGAPSVVAFSWTWKHRSQLPPVVRVCHEGRCGRCGRTLTVPESVASGYGPECIGKVGGLEASGAW